MTNKRDSNPDKLVAFRNEKGDSYEIPLYKIDSSKLYNDNGSSTKIEAKTYAYNIPREIFAESKLVSTSTTGIITSSGGGSKYEYGYDPETSSVMGYVTIYYSVEPYLSAEVYTLTRVTGGYTLYEAGVQVTSQTLSYGEYGVGTNGFVNTSIIKNPATSSWSYNTGFTDGVIASGTYNLGAVYTLNLKHGTLALHSGDIDLK